MNRYDFQPVKKQHNNFTYTAPDEMDNCSDLHVTNLDWGSVSVWGVKSLFERIKFLFTGQISLIVHGQGMPPVSLYIGDWYETKVKEAQSEK